MLYPATAPPPVGAVHESVSVLVVCADTMALVGGSTAEGMLNVPEVVPLTKTCELTPPAAFAEQTAKV